ncbi:MAG: CIA30 family protein, partial [Candidatus Aminicenantes bacterium]|nr:CIA30 family protein [Candidatus Aminicenantes bacterium]
TSFYNNVLLIGGSEFSLDCGHLACAGFDIEKYRFPKEPQEAVNDMNRYNGFSFISHPFDNKIPWTNWDVKDFTGIEVLSSYSSARRIGILKLFAFPFRYILNHEYALLSSLDYPEKNLAVWDSFNKKGKYMGIYALDAHAKIPLTKKISLNFPSYRSMFSILNIYVKTDKSFSSDPVSSSNVIVDSIKKGRYYNVIESISPANGFDIVYRSSDGEDHETGDTISDFNGTLRIDLPFKFPVRVKIIKNGKQFFIKRFEPSSKAEIRINGQGAYRCEIFADKGKFKKLPWIATNPFFIGNEDIRPVKEVEISFRQPVFNQIRSFKLENNNNSSGIIEYIKSDKGEDIISLDYVLRGKANEKNFWISLAARKNVNLSAFRGVTIESRSSETMRYWLEIRTGSEQNESWYRHSFLSTLEWGIINIPFSKLIMISGDPENKDIDTSKIRSIFISLNNSIVNFSETKGRIDIKSISSYK